jgi:hypothetical protein
MDEPRIIREQRQ